MTRLTLVTNPDRCNLRCPLCFLNQRGKPYGKGEMPLSVALDSIEKYNADGNLREVIPSTMGEPLLYTYFEELLEYCSSCRIPVNLTTNGTFPGFWGTEAGMKKLLASCSDIKVSCMAFDERTMEEMMPGLTLDVWKLNVCRLIELKKSIGGRASVSLQVTLHREMVGQAENLLRWAEEVGVQRIKWNLPVFLSSGRNLSDKHGINDKIALNLRRNLKSEKLRSEGSLFFESGRLYVTKREECPFWKNEVWVMPDGSEEECPNPEKRFGDPDHEGAKCEKCLLWGSSAQNS